MQSLNRVLRNASRFPEVIINFREERQKRKGLPRNAGLARLNFVDFETIYETERRDKFFYSQPAAPRRSKDIITLPDPQLSSELVQFFFLKDGQQFLLSSSEHGLWFGGTDERPFLVELDFDILKILKTGGEEIFFKALKPSIIERLENEFNVQAKRQGDIFAVPIKFTWRELNRYDKSKLTFSNQINIFGTRHKLTGRLMRVFDLFSDSQRNLVGEGILEAPDHTPRKLNRPHLFAQTQGLVNPKKAD